MKGIFQPSETFIKVLCLCIAVVSILVIFLSFRDYNVNVYVNKLKREAVNIGEASLASPCLAETAGEYSAKALLSEEKIEKEKSKDGISCLKYPKKFLLRIAADGYSESVGNKGIEDISYKNEFPAALKRKNGDVVPAIATVYLEKRVIS